MGAGAAVTKKGRIDESKQRGMTYKPMTVEEAAELTRVSPERLKELSLSGYAPHVNIDGEIWFVKTKIRAWVRDNLTAECEGNPYPGAMTVCPLRAEPTNGERPVELCGVEHLQAVAGYLFPPAVYFLVRNQQVVYVGQSETLGSRLATHERDGTKDFDSAFFLPVPRDHMRHAEAEFVKRLRPEYNKRADGSFRG